MSEVQLSQQQLLSIQEAMLDALDNDDAETLERLVSERDPHLTIVMSAVSGDDVLRQWIHGYWERDQDVLARAQQCLRVAAGRLSAYRHKRNASQSYLYDARQDLEMQGTESMRK